MMDSKFIEKLVNKTKSGVFRWKETAEDDMFRLTLKNGMILIQKEEEHYNLLIFDTGNREVDRVSTDSDSSLRSALEDLWYVARGSARKKDNVLSALMREVEQA